MFLGHKYLLSYFSRVSHILQNIFQDCLIYMGDFERFEIVELLIFWGGLYLSYRYY